MPRIYVPTWDMPRRGRIPGVSEMFAINSKLRAMKIMEKIMLSQYEYRDMWIDFLGGYTPGGEGEEGVVGGYQPGWHHEIFPMYEADELVALEDVSFFPTIKNNESTVVGTPYARIVRVTYVEDSDPTVESLGAWVQLRPNTSTMLPVDVRDDLIEPVKDSYIGVQVSGSTDMVARGRVCVEMIYRSYSWEV